MGEMMGILSRLFGVRKPDEPISEERVESEDGDCYLQLNPEEINRIRLAVLRKYVDKDMKGLEIGPAQRPVAPKREGYDVEIVDHLSTEELIKWWEFIGSPTDSIEEVDYVWNGQSYTELIGKLGYYDYIIACHVIEHVPDFIGFLNDCSNLLKESGVLVLAVPDKRFTFDHYRMVTTTGRILDAHLYNPENGSVGTYFDYLINLSSREGKDPYPPTLHSWPSRLDRYFPDNYAFIHTHEEIQQRYNAAIENRRYEDIHQQVFTPTSFKLIVKDLLAYGFIDFDIDTLERSTEEEFFVLLRKTRGPRILSDDERRELLRIVSEENVIR